MYAEDEYLALSGIQHYAFCPRQWALIHLEQQWSENVLTMQGNLMHERAHDEFSREKRGNMLIVRGLGVHSRNLGLSGKCDVVEFRRSSEGVPLAGEEGLWLPIPVEYKHGKAKRHEADRLQLCAQAMCLEEMLVCECGLRICSTDKREVERRWSLTLNCVRTLSKWRGRCTEPLSAAPLRHLDRWRLAVRVRSKMFAYPRCPSEKAFRPI